jgi:chromatin structure-remodeling complex subunit RSC1/2
MQKGKYKSPEDIYDDLILVMLNAEFYNEEGSQIYKDAVTLRVSFHLIDLEAVYSHQM